MRRHVDGGVLPDRALGARQPPHVKAVELDLLARHGGVDVPFGRGRVGLALVGVAMAGDQRQSLGPGVEPDGDQHPPDPVFGDADPARLVPSQLGADPPGPESGVAEREGDDPLLEVRADLVGASAAGGAHAHSSDASASSQGGRRTHMPEMLARGGEQQRGSSGAPEFSLNLVDPLEVRLQEPAA